MTLTTAQKQEEAVLKATAAMEEPFSSEMAPSHDDAMAGPGVATSPPAELTPDPAAAKRPGRVR